MEGQLSLGNSKVFKMVALAKINCLCSSSTNCNDEQVGNIRNTELFTVIQKNKNPFQFGNISRSPPHHSWVYFLKIS